MGAETVFTKKAVKYLGVRLDAKLSYWDQIKYAAGKAANVTMKLSRLMANVGGPTARKRRLLMAVTESILLYGCEIWAICTKDGEDRKRMASVQILSLIHI